MRILVCGGRAFADYNKLVKAILSVLPSVDDNDVATWLLPSDTVIIHGCAQGADLMADRWAISNGVRIEEFPADWVKHGRAAGPIRNQQMIDEGKPDIVIAAPGGAGTADMVRRAKAVGIKVIEL